MLSRILRYCYELSRNQWLRPAEVRDLQEKRLRGIIRHAYTNVPLYHRKLDSLSLKPEDIKSIDDLTRLPFTEKEEIRKGIPGQSIARGYSLHECVRMSTSGTSGGPMPVFRDKRAWDYSVSNRYYRRPGTFGLAPWNRLLTIDYSRPSADNGAIADDRHNGVTTKSRGREALGPSVSIFKRWVRRAYIGYSADEVVQEIVEYQPAIIEAYPSFLKLVAEIMTDKAIQRISPKALISRGEVLEEPSREFLRSSFGCEVFNEYGAFEAGPMAWECKKLEGLHVLADMLLLEVIRDGEQVGPGEEGEVVVTGLLNYAMPLIRYRIGDVAVLDGDQCSCGRAFPLLRSVEGRKIDCFTLSDGRLVTPRAIQAAIQGTPGVSRFQAVQHNVSKVTVELMRKESDPEVSVDEVRKRCHHVLGDDVEVEILLGDRKNLKAKFRPVISELTVSVDPRWTKARA